jgi:hypothetical protein
MFSIVATVSFIVTSVNILLVTESFVIQIKLMIMWRSENNFVPPALISFAKIL